MSVLPDDLIWEILTRLPAKSLHRFKSVSKPWLSVITNPHFISSAVSHSPPPSLHVISRLIHVTPFSLPPHFDLVPAPDVSHVSIDPTLLLHPHESQTYDPHYHGQPPEFVLQCRDGLLLFCVECKRDPNMKDPKTRFSRFFFSQFDREYTLFVCSVMTREWVRIPRPPHPLDQIQCVGFITQLDDRGGVSKFVLVEYLHLININGAMMLCFSSDTGKWVLKETDYVLGSQLWRADWSFVFNGRLYWLVASIGIISWDEDPFCAAENESKALCRLIPLPLSCIRPVCTVELASKRSIGVSGGFIQFVEMFMSGETVLRLWRLSDTETGEWVLQHEVSTEYLYSYLYRHLSLTPPNVSFLHPLDGDSVFFQTGAYIFCYNLRTGKVVSISKYGQGEFTPIMLPAWPSSIPSRLYACFAKEEGNELFKTGSMNEAISCYCRSITLSATAPAYANRAMAYLKMSQFHEAEADCTKALNIDGNYVKVYARRAIIRKQLGNLQGSMEDIEYALKLEPNNRQMKQQYTEIKSLLEKSFEQGAQEKA